jgi:hypothetical protein
MRTIDLPATNLATHNVTRVDVPWHNDGHIGVEKRPGLTWSPFVIPTRISGPSVDHV